MPPALILCFGPFRLDMANAQLWCETQPVRLTAKALQVLSYLAERPGQLVTKDELFEAVWPDTVVSDATLTSNIQAVRQVLGDDPRSPQYIETVHRRGFRFIVPVAAAAAQPVPSSKFQVPSQEEESQKGNGENTEQAEGMMREALEPLPSSPSSLQPVASSLSQDFDTPTPNTQHLAPPPPAVSRLWPRKSLVLAAVLFLTATILTVQYFSLPTSSTQHLTPNTQPALPLPDKPSLIVLPFVNLSGDPTQEYFSDGVTADITSTLSRLSNLFVISRTSAFTYKDKPTKLKEISREMGVQYVLEGSVRKTDAQLRITVELIDATTDHPLWTEQYDRPLTDIFALQDKIVQKIVTTLKLQLTLQEQGVIVRKHIDNQEAYDAFLRGVAFFYRTTKEANAQARQMYEKALALDPQYAEAYAWLSLTYYLEWGWRWSADPQTLEHALALAHQAVALDDSLPEAHSALSLVYAQKQQSDQAIAEGERAIALDPNNADSYAQQAEALSLAGRPEDALRLVEQAMRLNPRYPPWYLFESGLAYCLTGRYAEAIATLQELVSRSPTFLTAHYLLALSYFRQWVAQQSPAAQTLEPAVAAIQRALALNDSWYPNHLVLGSISLYQQHYEQALAEMERGVALAPAEAGRSYAALAVVLSCAGRTEEALEAAVQALRLKSAGAADDHLGNVGVAYAIAGHYEEARVPLQRYLSRYPNILEAHLTLAAVYSELGQDAEARAEAAEVLRLNPHFSLELHKQRMPIKDPVVLERYIAALRKAGLK